MTSNNKPVCLIIGAGPGIGYSVARKWSSNGHQVVVVRRSEIAQDVLDREIGPGVVAVRADVTDQDGMKAAVDGGSQIWSDPNPHLQCWLWAVEEL